MYTNRLLQWMCVPADTPSRGNEESKGRIAPIAKVCTKILSLRGTAILKRILNLGIHV